MFRKEVLDARSERLHGAIVLVRPVSSWLLVAVAALVTGCAIAYLVLGSYTKKATAMGTLIPVNGMVRITPSLAGVVSECHVKEGQRIQAGDVLFVLTDERRQINGKHIQAFGEVRTASLEQQRASLHKAKDSSRLLASQTLQGQRSRLEMLHDELSRNFQQIELQRSRVDSAEQILQRHRKLADEKFISVLALQEKEEAVAAQRASLLGLQRQNTELKRSILAIEDEIRQLPARTEQALANIERDLGVLEQEAADLQTRDRYAITAPMEGVVTSITAQVGQPTNGQPLAVLLPVDAQLEANLYLPSRAIGFIAVGQKVRLRYQAYPYQKFGQYDGEVKQVARSPIQMGELPVSLPTLNQEGVYRVTVSLAHQHILAYGDKIQLRPGMVLEADIEQDRRRLIEWILEPLYGIRKYLT